MCLIYIYINAHTFAAHKRTQIVSMSMSMVMSCYVYLYRYISIYPHTYIYILYINHIHAHIIWHFHVADLWTVFFCHLLITSWRRLVEIQPLATLALGAAARFFFWASRWVQLSTPWTTRMIKGLLLTNKLLHASKGLNPIVLVYFEWTHFPFSYSHADFSDRTEPGLWIS